MKYYTTVKGRGMPGEKHIFIKNGNGTATSVGGNNTTNIRQFSAFLDLGDINVKKH
jgi:hypothetical protein